MNFVLLDDETGHHEILSAALMRLCARHGWNGRIVLAATEADEVAAYAKSSREPTVYFLDIELGGSTSLRLSDAIHRNPQESYIVYVSAYPQYAMSCLHTHAFDYLLKPWTEEQLTDCMVALMRKHAQHGTGQHLQVDMGGRLLKIPYADILYFSRDRLNARMNCLDGSSLVWRESFSELQDRLPQEQFFTCHRSYIVCLAQIEEINWSDERLRLRNGQVLPIARRRMAALRSAVVAQGGRE